jgi:hypothetical protein
VRLKSRFILEEPLDLREEARLSFGGQQSEKLQTVGVVGIASMHRDDSPGHLLFKRFSVLLPVDPKGELFSEIKSLLRVEKKAREADVGDRDSDRSRSKNDAPLSGECDTGLFSLIQRGSIGPLHSNKEILHDLLRPIGSEERHSLTAERLLD